MSGTETETEAATARATAVDDERGDTSGAELDVIMARAVAAARVAEGVPAVERRRWLAAAADAMDADAAELVRIAMRESHLPEARLTGELARTTAQLRLFDRVLDEGSYLEATIDHPDPSATPPVPDLRRMLVPLGVVAVFSASNFPFAFSVAGGDTASALAAGNAVVVKAHPGHPELSARTARTVTAALAEAGAPDGLFALVSGFDVGPLLVEHPDTAAVGFTGSVPGGRALFDIAARRPSPIPFYGELGSLNPVVVTPDALRQRGAELARGLSESVTLGAGQFCTKPGVVFVPGGEQASDAFAAAVAQALPDTTWTLLTPSIAEGFTRRTVEQLAAGAIAVGGSAGASAGSSSAKSGPAEDAIAGSDVGIPGAGAGAGASADGQVAPVILSADVSTVLAHADTLLEESFGPSTLLVRYADDDELARALTALDGSLTATIHAEPDEEIGDLVALLRPRAGRILFGGWPTGVAVSWAQHHGGPYPSTTSVHTSVGATAIRRWLRPVTYQTAPEAALPPELCEGNPLGIVRRVDGVLGRS
ncbi:aldehyde dehydrogenase (NADP(+)) [Leifsonia sp. ALI-44-B]|nr:aldehyde dehydrogenase (NADP(+)) [Leifsonia sp. ALI-44-B]